MVHPEKIGKRTRMSFARINDIMELPYLIETQKSSYRWFLDKGLKEVFDDINPIVDYSGNMFLEFVDYTLDGEPKYEVEECKERDTNYSASLRVKVRYTNKLTGEIKDQNIFMADFPLMTETGTFIINGAERVIVSQLVRSPGAYFSKETDKHGKDLYSSQLIPNRGAWLEYETDSNNILYVRVDRTRKTPITTLIRALGLGTNSQIIDYFGEEERLLNTLQKDTSTSVDEGVTEIYRKLRPGEPATVDSARPLFNSMFFDPKRYDLMTVGRYKLNKKLALAVRLVGQIPAENIAHPKTGELVASKGELITEETAWAIQNTGLNRIPVEVEDGKVFYVIGNGTVDARKYFGVDFEISPDDLDEDMLVNTEALEEILSEGTTPEERYTLFKERTNKLIPKIVTVEDVFSSISYNLGLEHSVGETDDIDHLGNRRLRSVGELLQNQFRIGLTRLERVVRERMATSDPEEVSPATLVNTRPVSAALKEFFGSSQLSQFMDQPNPLAELTHKRRLSALGPGGLSRERAGFEVRDVHHSHYGRVCPIETPEGPNIGLIGSLSTYARVNKYGFIETPYRKVVDGHVTGQIDYIAADEEGLYSIAQANEPIDEDGMLVNERISGRTGKLRDFATIPRNQVDYMDISPRQIVSVATSHIPFLENDDANRALMGSNMQRQAVPLLIPEAPFVGTGIEHKAAKDSGVCIVSDVDGIVERVTASEIVILADDTKERKRYRLLKFKRSNQGTCINQHPIVSLGERVKKGDIIADGPSTEKGDLALGRNVLIGFMTWEGYNYEDAIIISEELVKEDVYTSIHIEEFEAEARETKLGAEEITRDIPNVGEEALKHLDSRGIIRIGAEVKSDDILVGKVTPKGESELSAEERLLRAIFGEKAREVRDTSLKVPHGESGIVVDVKEFSRENGDELKPGVNKLVRVYVAIKRKISVGDKMAGRHGNKGVISRILPQEDMPFLPDGTPLQIMLSPLGVPSRMNIGQVLEVHLGMVCRALGWHIATPVFDGASETDIMQCMELASRSYDNDYEAVNSINEFLEPSWKAREAIKKAQDEMKAIIGKDNQDAFVYLSSCIDRVKTYPDSAQDVIKQVEGYFSRHDLSENTQKATQILTVLSEVISEEEASVKTYLADCVDRTGGSMPALRGKDGRVTGKVTVYDGRTGEPFDNPVTVGYMYMLKLHHLVDEKMHSRSTGPYSLVTQQPLGGKAQFGGQRFGEMEVWALEAYGAANVLQEILTVKSDDIVGRVRAYEAIVKGENIPKPGIPESFKVLMKEFQSLCLDINVLDDDGNIIDLSEDYDISTPTSMMKIRKESDDTFTYEFDDEEEPKKGEAEEDDEFEDGFEDGFEDEYDDEFDDEYDGSEADELIAALYPKTESDSGEEPDEEDFESLESLGELEDEDEEEYEI